MAEASQICKSEKLIGFYWRRTEFEGSLKNSVFVVLWRQSTTEPLGPRSMMYTLNPMPRARPPFDHMDTADSALRASPFRVQVLKTPKNQIFGYVFDVFDLTSNTSLLKFGARLVNFQQNLYCITGGGSDL